MIESTEDHIWSVNLDYRLVTFNKAFQESIERIYGSQVTVGKLPEEFVSAERVAHWRRWFDRALSEGAYWTELELVDGRTLEMSFRRITQEGVTTGVGVFGKDITKRKAAEKATLEAERKYREMFDGSHIGFYRTEPEGKILMVNQALARMLGAESPDEVLTWNLEEGHFAPDYAREKFKKELNESGEIRGLEEIWQRHDGTKLYIRESARAVRDGSGKLVFYEGTVEDITQEKQAKEKYQEIFGGAIEGIYRRTMEGKTLVANPSLAKMLGYASVEEYLAEPAASAVQIWVDPRGREEYLELLQERKVIRGYECQFRRKDGTIIWVSLNSQLIRGAEGEPLYIEGFIEDISERKRAEALLSAANAQLSALIESNEDDVLSMDLDFRLVRFNERFKENIEKNNPGVHLAVGMLPEEYLQPAIAAIWRGSYGRVLVEGPFRQEFRTIDGRILQVALNRIVQDGVISGVSVFAKEVTAQKKTERALLEAVKRYREIFEGAIDGIYRTSLEGKPLLANPALARMLGYTSAEEFLAVVTDLAQQVWIDAGERARFVQFLRDQGEVRGFECQMKRKDGTIVWAALSSRLVRGGEGEALYNEGFVEDISERKRAEEVAKKSAEELKVAQRMAHLGSWTLDLKTSGVTWSDEMFRVMGVDPCRGALSYRELKGVFTPESWVRLSAEDEKTARTGNPYKVELETVLGDGRNGWVVGRGEAVMDAKGEVVGLRGTALDITRRKRAEAAAKKSTEELKEAQRIAHLGNWTLDLKTGYVTWSDEMFRMRGLEPSPQGAPSYPELEHWYSPESWARMKAEVEKTVRSGVPYEVELETVLPDGSKGWVMSRGEAVRDATGEVVELRGINLDISERKRAEEVARVHAEELKEAQRIAHLGNWTLDLKTGQVTWSDEMYRIVRIDPSLQGAPSFPELEHLLSPESWARLSVEVEKTVRTGVPYETEQELVFPDGSDGWVLVRGEAVRDATGEVVELRGVALDIGERKRAEEALRKSEAELKEAQRIAHLGNWTVDLKTGRVTMSDEMYGMKGLESSSQGAPQFMELEGLYSPESWARMTAEVKKTLCTGLPYEVELETILPDGGRGWVQARGEAVRDAGGEVVGLRGTSLDISERKRAEEAFRKSAAELQEAQRMAHLGNWTRDLRTGHTEWSDEMFRMRGLEPSPHGAPMHADLERFFTPESWARLNAEGDKTMRTGLPYEVELETVLPDGRRGWVQARGEAARDATGEVVGLNGISMDISERKRAEEVAKIHAEELQEAQRIAHLGNWTRDLKTGCVTWSDEMFRMRGLEPPTQGALTHQELEGMFTPESWARMNSEVERTISTGAPHEVELETVLPDGRKGWVLARGEAVRDERGEVVSLRGICMDLSQRKRAEAEKELLEAQLIQAQKMGAVGRLAGGIAHDFNNLLMVISAHTELLALKLEGAAAERTEAIMKATRRATELTGQLLAFSRKQTIQPTVTTMNQLVTGVSDMLQRLVGEDIEVKIDLGDEPLKVKTDRAQFEQVIMNLVVNARDAMPDGGRLTMETTICEIGEEYQTTHPLVPAGKYAMLAVTDTGVGMSSEVLAKAFEPFYTTKPTGKGTGLGLSLVYGIVKQSGGFVWAYSEVGQGTCFKIYLPEADGDIQMVVGRRSVYAPVAKKKGTILLVEDEESLREVVGNFLRSGGHKVIEVGTVEDACVAALEHRLEIDMMLTDVVLKGGNAKQLVKRLEEQGCSFRVMFMSGYTPSAIVHHGILEPGTLFLQKPFSRSLLLDKIEDALGMPN